PKSAVSGSPRAGASTGSGGSSLSVPRSGATVAPPAATGSGSRSSQTPISRPLFGRQTPVVPSPSAPGLNSPSSPRAGQTGNVRVPLPSGSSRSGSTVNPA